MPGVYQLSVDEAVKDAHAVKAAGIPGVLLFGLPDEKDEVGSDAYDAEAPVQDAVRAIARSARAAGDDRRLPVRIHVARPLRHPRGRRGGQRRHRRRNWSAPRCPTCGRRRHGSALRHDGRPDRAIREALDSGFPGTRNHGVLGKVRSAFYGPFREAAGSTPAFGDRRSTRWIRQCEEALREIELDIEEGADIVMVKPAMAYLDIIARARRRFELPIAAYQVSGEYAMIEAAARNGWIDEPRAMLETLTAIKRAGADIIITYYAREAARVLAG